MCRSPLNTPPHTPCRHISLRGPASLVVADEGERDAAVAAVRDNIVSSAVPDLTREIVNETISDIVFR